MAAKMNPDLKKERDGASFDPEKIVNFLYGGPDRVRRRREVVSLALDDPDFQHEDLNFMSREQQYETQLKKSILVVQKQKELGLVSPEDMGNYNYNGVFKSMSGPFGLHTSMFLPTLRGQATAEQKAKWLKMAENYAIIGTYAQTEMGHGTFLRGLETTSTYDPQTQEFVLNTPTPTGTKWWPGCLGKTSNYCVLMAQLYIHGKSYGPHPFMVQIRNLQDHKPLPGVTVGDIGPKFGYAGNDNGFLRFDNVRIPRDNMLMKYSRVMNYTIQVAGQPEPQVLDYVTQQYKLFPYLAAAYAFMLAARSMIFVYFRSMEKIGRGDITVLPELHALSSGLKSLSSWVMNAGIEECRMACGGHGYSHASGIPSIYMEHTPAATYEGENTVLMLQTARYLMKSYNQSLQGEKLAGSVAYLSGVQPVPAAGRTRNVLDLNVLIQAFQHRAARLVHEAALQLKKERQTGKDQPDAWNAAAVDLVKAAKAHSQYFVVKNFADRLTDPALDSAARAVLTRLCQLYALHDIVNSSGDFLEDGYLTGADIRQARRHINALMAKLRPDAVALVDAFDFPDGILNSILGRYDGNVYQHLLEWAKASPLNKTDVHESYYKYLKPFLEANRAKL
ncbi:peroxisomal acyl-coenzyme A oxidase 1-like [Branchiostoma floridae]|uniref:Acyl-coenzyme A oxidase n=1 Tax=Branchiostoma floridae TaxID=7739 RepID=A0A9J7HLV7_BRAFL|nr:peroxisomal acyl-coenzyme A oxidase 1-like [Branchiostoma floridae]